MKLNFQGLIPDFTVGTREVSKTVEADHVYKIAQGMTKKVQRAISRNGGDDVVFNFKGDTYVATARELYDIRWMAGEYHNYPTVYKLKNPYSYREVRIQEGDRLYRQNGELFVAAHGSHTYNDVGERMPASPFHVTLNGEKVDVIATDNEVIGVAEAIGTGWELSISGSMPPFALFVAPIVVPIMAAYGAIKSAFSFNPTELLKIGAEVTKSL